jgi:hypothetical protein
MELGDEVGMESRWESPETVDALPILWLYTATLHSRLKILEGARSQDIVRLTIDTLLESTAFSSSAAGALHS